MVVTPYTCGDETTENPSILAGHDGRTWEVPTVDGFTAPAPLVSNPEPCYAFSFNNNDPSLVLVGDSLFIYYAVTYRSGARGGTTEVRRIASADGVNWTPGERAPVMWSRPNYLLSPSVVYDGSGFHAWYVQLSSCDARVSDIRHRQSADGITWRNTDDYSATMTGALGVPYHLTVKSVGGVFAMLYVAYPVGADCREAKSLYYAESGDGLTWVSLQQPMLTSSPAAGAWDSHIYRSTFIGRYPTMSVWYSAHGTETCTFCNGGYLGYRWHLGYTHIDNHLAAPLLDVDTSSVAFGTVIQGAPQPSHGIEVHHTQRIVDDDLSYTISTSQGFETVPSGSFTLGVGGSLMHALEMKTAAPGRKSGSVQIVSNAVGDGITSILLSGVVLRHASPSLDSLASADSGLVDFGVHPPGRFAPQSARVFNLGYDALQARLQIASASIEGGEGRFSLAGAFQPVLLPGGAKSIAVKFDDTHAVLDSTYTATLTLTHGDELLPGAAALAPLIVTLRAHPAADPFRTPDGVLSPVATRLYPPYPNPLSRSSAVRFDLARAAQVRLELFDLTGRRVASLAHRAFDPGQYEMIWDGTDENGGRARPGLYFLRLAGDGIEPQTARLAVAR
jgi:hypothetical protein